jgi:hypothetical protein
MAKKHLSKKNTTNKQSNQSKQSKQSKHKSHKPKKRKYISEEDIMDHSDIDINGVDDFYPENADFSEEQQHDEDQQYDEDQYEDDYVEDDEVEVKPKVKLDDKTTQRLKKKIVDWLDYDDKIKTLNSKTKKYKDAKKQQEEIIIKMITKLQMEDTKIDVHDDQNNFRSRVYKHKSVTKEALKENIIKDALMEAIRDEKKVDQLIKKIDSKRPMKERYYLKRTKGANND